MSCDQTPFTKCSSTYHTIRKFVYRRFKAWFVKSTIIPDSFCKCDRKLFHNLSLTVGSYFDGNISCACHDTTGKCQGHVIAWHRREAQHSNHRAISQHLFNDNCQLSETPYRFILETKTIWKLCLDMYSVLCWLVFNSSPPGQSSRHFADDIFGCIFLTVTEQLPSIGLDNGLVSTLKGSLLLSKKQIVSEYFKEIRIGCY